MMKVFILLALVAAAFAQQPRPCESPRQWEGNVMTVDRSKQFFERGRISYDEDNRRFRIIEEEEIGSTRSFYDTLYLHNVGKEYKVNLKTRQCNVTALTRPFRPFGVPPEAKFEGEATIGAAGVPGESIVVVTFNGTFADGADKFFGTVTFPDCIPVETGFFSQGTGFVQRSFYDINLGITDPMAFIPPSECQGK